ncbi:hypothetical protein [Actinomycetospora corticicola]|uniref:Uncharacterized protein n=1 Tax=Actinomycetospora corticicola TaxID=663602 RepID=A0A7Y9J3X2_9PSEU|nr:hypothetical protein [Actinomycetospora corticicola]NYD34523.1 hypothetical protein [Actinomycetospora corticicola]
MIGVGGALAPAAWAAPMPSGAPCQPEQSTLDAVRTRIAAHNAAAPAQPHAADPNVYNAEVEQYNAEVTAFDAQADALAQQQNAALAALRQCLARHGVIVQGGPQPPTPTNPPKTDQPQPTSPPAPENAPEPEPFDVQENIQKALDWLDDRLEELDEMSKKDGSTDHDCPPNEQKHGTA